MGILLRFDNVCFIPRGCGGCRSKPGVDAPGSIGCASEGCDCLVPGRMIWLWPWQMTSGTVGLVPKCIDLGYTLGRIGAGRVMIGISGCSMCESECMT